MCPVHTANYTRTDRTAAGHPSLVVCPASLIYNWGEELQKFAPQLSACLILGTAAERKALWAASGEADVWVTSYELLSSFAVWCSPSCCGG